MKSKRFAMLFFALIFGAVLISSCDEINDLINPEDNDNVPPDTQTGFLVGTVYDANNSPLANVTVNVAGKTVTTNDQGYFSVDGLLPSSKILVNFSADGYVPNQKISQIVVGESSYITAKLATVGGSGTVSSTTGGSVTVQNVKFDLPANGFKDQLGNNYSGTVKLSSTYFDPTNSSFKDMFPGDFIGVSSSGGSEKPIMSYGFINASLTTPSGSKLDLISGSSVNIKFPIAQSLLGSAPQTIPMFYYDTTSGKWIEEGFATKVGNFYEGSVKHFTSWNWDRFYDVTYIKGRVVDADGNPIPNAKVEAVGQNYTGVSYRYTASDGAFTLGVRPNSHVIVTASKGGTSSSPITVNPTGSDGATYDVGDIILAPPLATITLTWSDMPEDLDSHLLIPSAASGGTPGHVYFGSKGSSTVYPYASLDTDDTDGQGPEIITIYKKYEGTYTYFVHNYTSTYSEPTDQESDEYGHLTSSSAKVNLIVQGRAYSFDVPSTNSNNLPVWRAFELKVDAAGNVTVNLLNDFVKLTDVISGLPKINMEKK